MKKFVINFMSIDMPSVDDDGVTSGTNFGVIQKGFDSKEEAEKYLIEELIPGDKADLEECYGFDDEECEPDVELEVEEGTYGRKELNVYDKFDGELRNSTIYDITEVEF